MGKCDVKNDVDEVFNEKEREILENISKADKDSQVSSEAAEASREQLKVDIALLIAKVIRRKFLDHVREAYLTLELFKYATAPFEYNSGKSLQENLSDHQITYEEFEKCQFLIKLDYSKKTFGHIKLSSVKFSFDVRFLIPERVKEYVDYISQSIVRNSLNYGG